MNIIKHMQGCKDCAERRRIINEQFAKLKARWPGLVIFPQPQVPIIRPKPPQREEPK